MQTTDRSTSIRNSSCRKPTSSSRRPCKATRQICSHPSNCRFPPSSRLHELAGSAKAKTAPDSEIRSRGTQVMHALSGKTALITGASRGIGRASALALAKAGVQVLVHYGSSAKEAEVVVIEIRTAGGRAEAIAVHLAAHECA